MNAPKATYTKYELKHCFEDQHEEKEKKAKKMSTRFLVIREDVQDKGACKGSPA